MIKGILPKHTEEQKVSRESRDDFAYSLGRSDAEQELPRDPSVYYDNKRDIDCYNMGYSAGEYYNGK